MNVTNVKEVHVICNGKTYPAYYSDESKIIEVFGPALEDVNGDSVHPMNKLLSVEGASEEDCIQGATQALKKKLKEKT